MLTSFYKVQNLTYNNPLRPMKSLTPSVKSFYLLKQSKDESPSAGNHSQAPLNNSDMPYNDSITTISSTDDEDRNKSKDNPAAHPSTNNRGNESAHAVLSLEQPIRKINVPDGRLLDKLPDHHPPYDTNTHEMKKVQGVIYFFYCFNGRYFSGTITDIVFRIIRDFEQCDDQVFFSN